MSVATGIVIGIQIILSLVLVVVVLLQNGNQRGLSGSIAGGAETFFGKNKGRTLDAKMKKWTAVVAALYLISSIALSMLIQADNNKVEQQAQTEIEQMNEVEENAIEGEVVEGEAEAETETEETAE